MGHSLLIFLYLPGMFLMMTLKVFMLHTLHSVMRVSCMQGPLTRECSQDQLEVD